MRKLDEIFKKRLERIREELESYIESGLGIDAPDFSAPIPGGEPVEKKKGEVQEKFLHFMNLNDEEYDDEDYLDDEAFLMSEQEEINSENNPMPKLSMQDSVIAVGVPHRVPVEAVKMPDFSKKNGKHLDIDRVLEKKEESFSEMLLRMIDEKGLKDSDVYKRANIDRRLFSKIRGDEDYVPSKKTAISFCLALQLELEEAKKLLGTAGYTLSASSRFDLIIMYLIENSEYNIHFANIVLDDYGEGTLSR